MTNMNTWFPGFTVEDGGTVYDTAFDERVRQARVVLGYVHEYVIDRPRECFWHYWYTAFPPSWQ